MTLGVVVLTGMISRAHAEELMEEKEVSHVTSRAHAEELMEEKEVRLLTSRTVYSPVL